MRNFVYVDHSNVWIEGKRVSAVKKGLAPDMHTAFEYRIVDQPWSYDFGRLLEFAGGDKKNIARAVLYGSRPPPADTVWQIAKNRGFEPVIYDRNSVNKEKKIDSRITLDITKDLLTKVKKGDEITLCAGDADHVPVAEEANNMGIPFHVVFWEHAAARELRDVAASFTSLTPHFDFLSLK